MENLLKVLVVEDHPDWRELLQSLLRRLGGPVKIDAAADLEAAQAFLDRSSYDLATIDIALRDDPSDELGLAIVDQIFRAERHRFTALLAVTGHDNSERTRKLLLDRNQRVFDLLWKRDFKPEPFLERARDALFDARCRQAEDRLARQYSLRVRFGRESWLGSDLHGPDIDESYQADPRVALPVKDLSDRADRLNWILRTREEGIWREDARELGRTMYRALQHSPEIAAQIAKAVAKTDPQNPLLLQLAGPSSGLGLPFELMQDGDDFLCFRHLLVRKITQNGKRVKRFHEFLRGLKEDDEKLRVLLVGANADGNIPKVTEEVQAVLQQTETGAARLGISVIPEVLVGPEAEYKKVSDALQHGGFHLFHYAGHGRFQDTLSETSGLVLGHGEERRTLTAATLKSIAEETPLQFIFLSCCVGARNAQQVGRGDFQGTLEALARADVPVVLGHRWRVSDRGAMELAVCFHRSLWESLSPSRALLEARRTLSRELGRDESTWASPILLSQTD